MTAPLQPTPDTPADGALLLGDYALGARVERRTTADVFEATHVPSGEPRLVYVLHPAAARDNPFVHQVVCEIDAARWLRHPATAKVDAHGETPTGAPYVAVLRPAGRPLAQALTTGELVGRRRFVRLANRLVEALDEAHTVGLYHGRLTPHAIVIGEERDELGTPPLTVTGFGVAAMAHDGPVGPDERPYIAPERQAGADADERSDVFSLASVLHHLLTGAAPGAPGPAAAGGAAPTHASALAVLAMGRAAAPAHRSRSVKALWEELMAALVDDAAATDAAAAATPAPAAAAAPARTSGEIAVRTLLEQLVHERAHAPAEAPKAMLLSPMRAGAAAVTPAAFPLVAPPVAQDPWAGPPATANGSAAFAALASLAAPTAAPTAPLAPVEPEAPALPAPWPDLALVLPATPARSSEPPAPAEPTPVRRSRPVPVADAPSSPDRGVPDRGVPDRGVPSRGMRPHDIAPHDIAPRPPARSYRPRPGFLLATGIAAPLAFLAVFNWPGPIDAAPAVDPDPPAVVAVRAAMAVEAAKDRRARQAMSGLRQVAGAEADSAADSLVIGPLPRREAPLVMPAVAGIRLPTVQAPGAAPVRRDEFRRMRADSLP